MSTIQDPNTDPVAVVEPEPEPNTSECASDSDSSWSYDTGTGPFYDRDECIDAMNGVALPRSLNDPTSKSFIFMHLMSTIRGVRHSLDMAMEPRVIEICAQREEPKLTRARNARLIMSDIIPDFDMDHLEDVPYCIWFPDVAKEDTYRELARRYPHLRYHVGRACAVAGYTDLYRSLDLLPDISIAEEARENKSTGIFEDIKSSPVRYHVMDDYTLSVNLENPTHPAFLNADTITLSFLKRTVSLDRYSYDRVLTVTEDNNLAEYSTDIERIPIPPDSADVALLSSPLPADLPDFTISKDILILMAAYEGNVDRYARLRRPFWIKRELECVVRGIYHNTSFAKWWVSEVERPRPMWNNNPSNDIWYIKSAIAARFIMLNNLTYVLKSDEPMAFPAMFWYPLAPHPVTLKLLAEARPKMTHWVLQACIALDYKSLYDTLKHLVEPHEHIWDQAKLSANPYYRDDLERRGEELGVPVEHHPIRFDTAAYVKRMEHALDYEEPSNLLIPWPAESWMISERRHGPYSGAGIDAGEIELFITAPEPMKWMMMERESSLDIDSAIKLYQERVKEEEEKKLVEGKGRDVEGGSEKEAIGGTACVERVQKEEQQKRAAGCIMENRQGDHADAEAQVEEKEPELKREG
ncbi:hypothetical protein jhhlp_006691 [Lomentospora prolificans]|uniref:Uncharacterized protein n=1 Tax=Lomentospora prolificans TaxID=41688 RepID=A0A2N3N6L0_9PEZI|nr:hypothetical protein jhhlp_006691 [Lomentospora prolificans]